MREHDRVQAWYEPRCCIGRSNVKRRVWPTCLLRIIESLPQWDVLIEKDACITTDRAPLPPRCFLLSFRAVLAICLRDELTELLALVLV